MKKIKSISKPEKKINYKKRLWKVFSEYIRRRDDGHCFTCSAIKYWKETDAGHYIPNTSSNPSLYFDERNVHCQCTSCNRYKSGNLSVYAINLEDRYGQGILQELWVKKNIQSKWSDWTYKIKIDEYKKKLKEL